MPADVAIVVLAAGKGTRLKSERAKVLHEAGGLPLIAHVLRATTQLTRRGRGPVAGVWVVVGHQAEAVRAVAGAFGARTVLQRPQLGTGHAVAQAVAALPRSLARLLVLPGDAPLVRAESLGALIETQSDSGTAVALLTARFENPYGYGRIVRAASGEVEAIIEQSALRPEQAGLREVNSGIYCFHRAKLLPLLAQLGRDNVHREYYLTDVIALLRRAGEKVSAHMTAEPDEILGVNTPAELARVDTLLRRRKAEALMGCGVTLYQPETLAIGPDVAVAPDTIIERGVELRGATRIGRRCRIGAFSILHNAVLADNVTVKAHCLVLNSRLGEGVVVGPFAHLRDGADIRAGARIGNYVEVKKSVVREGAKAQHLTYLGDATVGRKTNIGAGTITCNYDGVNKHPTTIGDGVFIGSGTELVAPVKVGRGAYVAAGSTITDNVPPDTLAIARGRQVNKSGWARTRREKLAVAKARKEEPPVTVGLAAPPRPAARKRAARSRPRRQARRR
ncbi:MAG: bifunctional UDP-N-acetylglucosamine diphosphorylase/glucosamine-1-phosphate N-acetyltransferase GlmU [Acidobacteria bacterium]|nr:bifunctional UDP-N-acetylglucosamine diphosphorylase/glucosamine-1-phosphate N-acetyltransferase GlmU [Acidobacteriota bacterium]